MGQLDKKWKIIGQGRTAEVFDIGINKVLKLLYG